MDIITENQRSARRNILMNLLSVLGYDSIANFQKANNLVVDGLFGNMSYKMLYGQMLNIVDLTAFGGHYYLQVYPKDQIVWHHSAGWDNARGMYDWWRRDKVYHVATSIGITDRGQIFRGYDEQFWAHHIGMQHWLNLQRNQRSIAVEICNWGSLTEKDGKLYSWAGVEISKEKAIELNYKGYQYYEAYTEAEIDALKYWTLLNAVRFDIPVRYSEDDMWQVSHNAINGKPGIYTHNSFISWKTDVSPQPNLISMAKGLSEFEQ